MAKTAAERKRKQRENLKAKGLFKEFKKKESANRKRQRRLIKQTASLDMLKALREKKSEDMRRYRRKIKEKKPMLESTDTPARDETPTKAFASKSSYGKVVAKVKRNLPFSPSKCRAVVHTSARQITPEIVTPKHKKPKKTISADTVEKVKFFYLRDVQITMLLYLKLMRKIYLMCLLMTYWRYYLILV
ncbi:hypothetical protein WA026_016117 [Henosepilachna vigintioctopunctata]|uniref:Uncharacterized protein n=1 Tax=Henosepilachna vigintioctopunctata TaxID=420089 RepID=A0AAW1TUH0_9CUCU